MIRWNTGEVLETDNERLFRRQESHSRQHSYFWKCFWNWFLILYQRSSNMWRMLCRPSTKRAHNLPIQAVLASKPIMCKSDPIRVSNTRTKLLCCFALRLDLIGIFYTRDDLSLIHSPQHNPGHRTPNVWYTRVCKNTAPTFVLWEHRSIMFKGFTSSC